MLLAGGAAPAGAASRGADAAALARARQATPAGAALPYFASPRSAVADGPGDEDPTATEWNVIPPTRRFGATTALVVQPTPALAHAGHGRVVWRVPTQTTWSGQPMILLVLESVVRDGRRWLKVRLPERPSGSSGWIAYDDVLIARTRFWVDIDRDRRTVRVLRRGREVRRFRAVVGARSTPTPTGLAAVYERNRQRDPRAFLGPWAVALTLTSNVLQEFDGGPGRIGIHGRSGASLRDPLGTARSHGCIRVKNRDIEWFATRVPQGVPVRVR